MAMTSNIDKSFRNFRQNDGIMYEYSIKYQILVKRLVNN